MKSVCPPRCRYAVVQLDPVGMVKHFRDPIATAEAREMRPKKYLVYLDTPLDLLTPNKSWFRFCVVPIATTLRPEVKEKGITSDMVIPIYPNTHHPGGPRDPIYTHPAPFPFPNCYHWYDNDINVRVRRKATRYDDSHAYRVDYCQHSLINEGFRDDILRICQFRLDKMAASDRRPSVRHLPAPQHGTASSSLHSSMPTDEGAVMDNVDSLPEGPDDADTDSRSSSYAASHDDRRDSDHTIDEIFQMDPFGFHVDHTIEFMPLVYLWFELTEHLTAETIPNPVEFEKERETITRIIHGARERAPDDLELPLNDSGMDIDPETTSIMSAFSRREFAYKEYSLIPAEVRERLGIVLHPPVERSPQPSPTGAPGMWQRVKNRARRRLWHPPLWQAHPPLLPCWP
ncbi:hypothetical protein BC628DRAFT_1321340 [Trametes gibbosa]|nr:hypothetical protein BC628DRAFT_1321340 [Trametes gibbosa]